MTTTNDAPAPAPSGRWIISDDGKFHRVESADGWWKIRPVDHIDAAEARALCDRIRALASDASPRGEADWLDIRSAPLDGTMVDLWVRPHDAEANGNPARIADAWFSTRWMRFVPGEEGSVPVDRCGIPTHWRPRPGAPSTDKPDVFDTWKDIAGLLRSGAHDRALMTKGAIVIEALAEELAALYAHPAPATVDREALYAACKVFNESLEPSANKFGATERIIKAYLAALAPATEGKTDAGSRS